MTALRAPSSEYSLARYWREFVKGDLNRQPGSLREIPQARLESLYDHFQHLYCFFFELTLKMIAAFFVIAAALAGLAKEAEFGPRLLIIPLIIGAALTVLYLYAVRAAARFMLIFRELSLHAGFGGVHPNANVFVGLILTALLSVLSTTILILILMFTKPSTVGEVQGEQAAIGIVTKSPTAPTLEEPSASPPPSPASGSETPTSSPQE